MARRWYIDECSPTRVAGWVDDDGPVEGIEIAINGRPVKRLTPTDYRKDLQDAGVGEPIPAASKLVLYHFDSNLGRISNVDYPGWYRSFCFAINYGAERGFDKIIHLESDAYVLSQRAVDYFNAADKGWTAMWAPRHDYAESGIQIIGRDALDAAVSFCRADYA